MPIPVSETGGAVVESLSVIISVPDALPADLGANVTANATDWPTATVRGNESPPTLKLDPAIVAPVIVMLAPDVFKRLLLSVAVCPTVTLPKLKVALPTVTAWLFTEAF
jgi:hypothetical protein